ncbi:MAG: FHA domain-containing protein [Hyalangium sp.]|uniref:FHA domain-containing protein n=1 Tax=Hyalangium sp. TaxID=2028555 RepID=UPI00389982B5
MGSSDETRIVRLPDGASRKEAVNEGTRVANLAHLLKDSAEEVFNSLHPQMAAIHSKIDRPGVIIFAASARGLDGHLWLEAGPELRAGSIGRHGAADLYLPGDEQLSLRHLVVTTRASERGVHTRIIDLRTPAGFTDDHHKPLRAIEADGWVVVGMASYWLFVFVTGQPLPWDTSTRKPWRTLPQRVYVETQKARRRAPEAASRLPRSNTEITNITSVPGPVDTSIEPLLLPGEPVAARLMIHARGPGQHPLAISAASLARGVILGRYSRCDGSALFTESTVSRVHALIITDEDDMYLIDVGSTCGTWDGEQRLRAQLLTTGRELRLGEAVRLSWNPAH